jgi:hypothetical protein
MSVKALNRPLFHGPKADRSQFMQRAFLFTQNFGETRFVSVLNRVCAAEQA